MNFDLEKGIKQFNREVLGIDEGNKGYIEGIYVKKEIESIRKSREEMCLKSCIKGYKENGFLKKKEQWSFEEMKCYLQCIKKIKEVDEIVNEFLLNQKDKWKTS